MTVGPWALLIAFGPSLGSIPYEITVIEPQVIVVQGFDTKESCEVVSKMVTAGPNHFVLTGCVERPEPPSIQLPPLRPDPPKEAPENSL